MSIVVSGTGLALAGAVAAIDLLAQPPSVPIPVDVAARIGRKGLRYQDRATHLALCAADEALRMAGLLTGVPVPGEPGRPARARLTVTATSVAVLTSSNFGNLDSVRDVIDVVAATGSTRLTSPILAPRLSSNVVSSETAIRFGLRGANLTLCNGATSGLDVLHWASCLIVSGRVRHALVIGVEPANDVVRALTGRDRLLDGAAAVVLEDADTAQERGAAALARLGSYTRAGDQASVRARIPTETVTAWFMPEDRPVPPDADGHNLTERWGSASGALGVLQCVAAVGHFAKGGSGPVCTLAGTDADDACSALLVHGPTAG